MPIERPVTFRIAEAADIPAVQELSSRIWREHYPGIITHEQIDFMLNKMYADEVLREEIERQGHTYVLVLRNGETVGYIAYAYEAERRSVKLSKLYLLPLLHGKGIGRLMLGRVRDDAARLGATTVSLFVNKKNVKAIAAYERFGFIRADAVVTPIGGGFVMDDYRMDLPL